MSRYEHVSPQSPDSSSFPPLDPPSQTSHDDKDVGLVMSTSRQRRLGFRALMPTLAVFFLTSGLGLGVLIWLFVKRENSVSDAFGTGYVLVDEGVKKWDSMESATLRALTATSLIVSFHLLSAVIFNFVTHAFEYRAL